MFLKNFRAGLFLTQPPFFAFGPVNFFAPGLGNQQLGVVPSGERPGRRNWRLRRLANRQFHSVPRDEWSR